MNRAILQWLGLGLLAAQLCVAQSSLPATGTPAFNSFGGGPFDTVNLGNLNYHFAIPVFSRNGRGISFYYNFSYDSSIYTPSSTGWVPVGGWGWQSQTDAATGYIPLGSSQSQECYPGHYHIILTYPGFIDSLGTYHHINGLYFDTGCGQSYGSTATADDGSGYTVTMTTASTGTITSVKGKAWNLPAQVRSGPATVTDTNGNQITTSDGTTFYDTLSSTTPVMTISGTNPVSYTYTGPSGNVAVKMNYGTYPIRTAFNCGIPEYSATGVPLVSSILMPDNSQYTFNYEKNGSNYTGRLSSVTLPTGGTITYSYPGAHGGIECADGSAASLNRTLSPGGLWIYTRSGSGTAWTTTISTPPDPTNSNSASDVTVINFAEDSAATTPSNNFYETQRKVYQGAATGTPLETVVTCYNGKSPSTSCPTAAVASPITEVNTYRQFNTSSQARVDTFYSATYQLPTRIDRYDFGATTPSQKTVIAYASGLGNILGLPACVQITAGSTPSSCGTVTSDTVALTNYLNYDSHGNVGKIQRWVTGISSPTYLNSSFTYYSTGLVHVATDVNGAQTTYTYGDCNSAFPTNIAEPLSLSKTLHWDCNGGVPLWTKDENQQPTTYNTYDVMWRATDIDYPDGGDTEFTYNFTADPPNITAQRLTDSSNHWLATQTNLDGLGRVSQTQLTTDPSGVDYVDTSYDALGRVYSVSNPHRSTSSGTDGTRYYAYDALGRVTKVTNPDGTYLTKSYSNRAVLVTDESGIQKAYQSDGLGRLQYVCDGIGAVKQANNASTSDCGLDVTASGFLTAYGHDAIGNLTSVNLSGQTRSFTYDGLSRMVSSSNPESGVVTNAYDSSTAGDLYTSKFPQPNVTSGTVTATYSWDALHRLTGITFSDGSGGYSYVYDASSWWGATLLNPKGRLIEQAHTGGGAAIYSYDSMGRIADTWQCTPLNCSTSTYHMAYTYNYLGEVTTLTDAASVTYTRSYNSIGQLTGVTSSLSNTSHPSTLFSTPASDAYNPLGQLAQGTYGDGIVRNNTYNNMGRVVEIQDGPTATPTYRSYLGYYGNGSVSYYHDTVGQTWNLTYDAFNRLATFADVYTGLDYSYSYDQYGNRWQQHLTGGTGYEVDLTFDGNNRITTGGFKYDAAGNLTSNGSCTPCWVYDDAGNLTGGGNATYSYDGLGNRNERISASGTRYDFALDQNGNAFDEYQGTLWSRTTGGFFSYANNSTYFNRTDNLGMPRVSTDYTGALMRQEFDGPFGDGFIETASPFVDFTGFAGGAWDAENNADHFGAREYSKTQGRWLSPDPAGMAAVKPSNPQTWNRYAYVTNNPTSYTDPLGLYRDGQCSIAGDSCDGGGVGGGGMGGFCDASGDCSGLYWNNGTQGGYVGGASGFGPNGVPWNWGPGYNYYSTSGAAVLLSAEAAWVALVDQTIAQIRAEQAMAGADPATAACIAKGLQSAFPGSTVTSRDSTGEVGGHWNFALQLQFSSYDAANAFYATYKDGFDNGVSPPARFGAGPALHLENVTGPWDVSGGTYTIGGTAHIDWGNPNPASLGGGGLLGLIDHTFGDGVGGWAVQLFSGSNIDPGSCPF